MPGQPTGRRRFGDTAKKLVWFFGLWLAGVMTLAFIALIIRSAIGS